MWASHSGNGPPPGRVRREAVVERPLPCLFVAATACWPNNIRCPNAPLLLLVRSPEVRELLQNIGVGLEARGWTLILGQERDSVIDHIVSKGTPVRVLRGFRRI